VSLKHVYLLVLTGRMPVPQVEIRVAEFWWWYFRLWRSRVKIDRPGAIFYLQEGVGQHGARFTVDKFRSMVQNAPAEWSGAVGGFG
jgi:hypothetical protein